MKTKIIHVYLSVAPQILLCIVKTILFNDNTKIYLQYLTSEQEENVIQHDDEYDYLPNA